MQFNYVKSFGVAAGVVLGLAAASAGAATTVSVTGAGFYPGDTVTFDGDVAGNPAGPYSRLTGPIALNLNGSSTLTWVYCLDWNHTIDALEGAQFTFPTPLTYTLGPVTTDSTGTLSGTGLTLGAGVSEEINTLLALGVPAAEAVAAGGGNPYAPLAYQAAIWDIEYGLTQPDTGPDPTPAIELDLINSDIAYAIAHPSALPAQAFYSTDGLTQALGTVPEPATWSLMLMGFGGLGVAMRSRRKAATA